MIYVIEISIEEFKKDFYDKYIKLFPKDEQRDWKKVEDTYSKGIEHFYKIVLDNKSIGFFFLEKLDNNPYYIDYFAVYKEYQDKGYGTQAVKYILDNIAKDGLVAEIEKVVDNNPITKKRFMFYEKLGFKLIESEYLLYDVYYMPIININKSVTKEEVDKIMFNYYLINVGKEELAKNCRIVK